MAAMTGAAAPLHGMRVLDLSQQLPGPYASLLLASLGAQVTKVEPPTGDPARELDPAMFARVNAGKAILRLDLKVAADRERLHDNIAHHDVLLEGFRPGVAKRLGFDYPTARRLNPRLVYCSISGFGQTGPLARHPSHDLTLQAMAGAVPDAVELDRIGVPWVDLGTATTAAFAICAHWRQHRGVYLDLAMLDTATAWASVKPEAVSTPEATYGTFRTADDRWVTMALLEDSMWRRLCHAFGWDDWAHQPEYETYELRRRHTGVIRRRLCASIAQRSSGELHDTAVAFDLPLMPVRADTNVHVRTQLDTRAVGAAKPWGAIPIPSDLLAPVQPPDVAAELKTGRNDTGTAAGADI